MVDSLATQLFIWMLIKLDVMLASEQYNRPTEQAEASAASPLIIVRKF